MLATDYSHQQDDPEHFGTDSSMLILVTSEQNVLGPVAKQITTNFKLDVFRY